MEKVEIRAVIKYLSKKGMSPKEIHEDFMDTHEKDSPSYSTVKTWAAELKKGRESICDDERSGGRQKGPPKNAKMKLPKRCTILLCATEGETCDSLLSKLV
jgi:transposase